MSFELLAAQCAPHIHPTTLRAVVHTESSFNPYAIGVVGGRLERQPTNLPEAVATVRSLKAQGIKFSAGIGQIYVQNWKVLGLNDTNVFEPCTNLHAAQTILQNCFARSIQTSSEEQVSLQKAISCYYSNNFTTGFKEGYVRKVLYSAEKLAARDAANPPKP